MPSGRLRDYITVERGVAGSDGYGNTTTSWVALVNLWADMRETPGKERVEAGRLEAARTATIRVRFDPATADLTEADRIVARGETWNIRSIGQLDRQGAMLEILCETGVAV